MSKSVDNTATVTAHYYSDSNGNGTQDGGESNLSGITVSVYLTDGTLVKTLTTNASGDAVFAAPPGPYNVAFAAPSGKYLPVNAGYEYLPSATYGMGGTRSGSASWNVGLLTGTPSYNGTSGTGNVTGRLFTDNNSNGAYDGTDTILSGITVNLYKYDGTNLTLDQTTTTNGSGNFTLNSPDKTYYLEFTGVSGEFYFGSSTEIRWTNLAGTTAVTGSHTGTKAFGDIGVKPTTTMPTVSGYVYDDANGNGTKDGGESYISGVAVTVYPFGRTSGGVSGTTNGSGYYSITAPASVYQVQFTAPTNKYLPLNDGTATTVLGWASVAGASGTSETLEGTSSLDVGMRGGGTATTVNLFDDLNGNGNYNSGSESYLSGITVSLYVAGTSTIIDTETSDASGNVSFPTYPGKYELRYATAPIGRVFPQNVDLGWTSSDGRAATGAIMSGATSTSIAIRQADDTPPFIGTARSDFTYDDANFLKSEVRYYNFAGTPVVARTTYTYDGSHKVKQIKTIDAKTSPTTLADYQYSYDASGRVTVQNDNNTRTTYAYDATNQITGEDFAAGTDGAYTYDLNGNRTVANGSSYTTGTDNRITGDGTYTFTYFNEGMLKEKTKVGTSEKWNYFYDNVNHLTKIERKTNGSAVDLRVLYTYDANGSRVISSVDVDGDGINNATVTKYMLDGWNPSAGGLVEVYSDLGDDGSLKTRYLRGDKVDQLLARVEHTGDHAGTYWYLTDNLGSIRKVIDSGASIKDAITYDAYGNIASETDSSYRGRYAWTGREIEVEAKLQFNRARYYDPSIGRWIAKDPIGFDAGDSNLYRYVNNAPTNYGDPSGYIGEGSSYAGHGVSKLGRGVIQTEIKLNGSAGGIPEGHTSIPLDLKPSIRISYLGLGAPGIGFIQFFGPMHYRAYDANGKLIPYKEIDVPGPNDENGDVTSQKTADIGETGVWHVDELPFGARKSPWYSQGGDQLGELHSVMEDAPDTTWFAAHTISKRLAACRVEAYQSFATYAVFKSTGQVFANVRWVSVTTLDRVRRLGEDDLKARMEISVLEKEKSKVGGAINLDAGYEGKNALFETHLKTFAEEFPDNGSFTGWIK